MRVCEDSCQVVGVAEVEEKEAAEKEGMGEEEGEEEEGNEDEEKEEGCIYVLFSKFRFIHTCVY